MSFHPSNIESLLLEGHHAHLVWSYLEQQNLKGMYDAIKARQGSAKRARMATEEAQEIYKLRAKVREPQVWMGQPSSITEMQQDQLLRHQQ